MTKKDYKLIAGIIEDAHLTFLAKETLINTFSIKLKEDNPLFNANKFAEACGRD